MDKAKLFAQAEKCVVKGQYEKALESFDQILRVDPYDSKALSRAADLYLKKENFDKGIECLRRLAESYTKDGFFSKAVAIYKRILKIDHAGTKDTLIQVHEKLADLYGQLSLVSDAMSHFSLVVDHYDRALNHEALLNVLKKVSDLDPYNIDSQLKLAELFLGQNRKDEAGEALQKLSENIQSRGHLPDIIRVYERWAELIPGDFKTLGALVENYLKVNEPKKALARIQVAFKTDPRNPEVLELLSETFQNLKQADKARAVDFELVKIYREKSEVAKAEVVEKRLKGEAPPLAPAPAPGATVIEGGKQQDLGKGDALLQASELEPEEKKVISESDVYVKYGLADKAMDVLKKNLDQLAKSIPLRWRLKQIAEEREEKDLVIHLLSEIILLGQASKKTQWADVAAEELRSLDPSHPALGAKAAPVVKKPEKAAIPSKPVEEKPLRSDTTQVEDINFNDFEPSEISIVIEEDDVAPAVEAQELLIEENSESGPVLELDSPMPESGAQKLDLALDFDQPSESSEPQPLLTEADFTADELNQLSSQLEPEISGGNSLPDLNLAVVDEPSTNENKERRSDLNFFQETSKSGGEDPSRVSDLDILQEPSAAATRGQKPDVEVDQDFEIKQALEEVEFFKAQGLDQEASSLLASLRTKYPSHPLLQAKQSKVSAGAASTGSQALKSKTLELEALGRKMKINVQEDSRGSDEDSFFDLASELDKELEEVEKSKFSSPAEVRDVFNAFKQGVSQAVSEDDWQTHFDLGVAYREMGLVDDAVQEFEIVAKTPNQRAAAFYQIGLCEVAKGQFDKAKEKFDQALKVPDILSQEKISITYELADVLLRLDKKDEAKKLFKEVQKADPEFREVTEKVKVLG